MSLSDSAHNWHEYDVYESDLAKRLIFNGQVDAVHRKMQTSWSEGKEKQHEKLIKIQEESKVIIITTTTIKIRKERNQLFLF